ncbi:MULTISPECIES: HIRAN domain-containing protein [unclassified Thioalkalivibrio]|uniref:HIRAN domain-containing protein n=1 Tax=unclassified Thioalkalivibrio TaxID=2621013 RepID=UPI0003622F3B|nr:MULTISPECIES: HIRAN domain-containing protein [unclassified Thioalkalivibrio]
MQSNTPNRQARRTPVLRGYYARRGAYNATATTEELLETIPLAGFRHHEAPKLWDILKRGQALTVERERTNTHDEQAVAVRWMDHHLGYLPRDRNGLAARLLDQDQPLIARILEKRDQADRHNRLELGLYRARPRTSPAH